MHVRHVDLTIIGGGAAGVLLLAHLTKTVNRPIDVAVIDRGPGPLGAGTAYRTNDPLHHMNVRASALSAWHDRPGDFTDWLGDDAGPDDFVPRARYGAYLAETGKHLAGGDLVRVTQLTGSAVGVTKAVDAWDVRVDDGSIIRADHVVLATGVEAPSTRWAPAGVTASPRFIADPWRAGALDHIADGDPVLIVGTGLTAVDIALTLGTAGRGRCITAVSRHGLLPATHTAQPLPPMPVDDTALPETLTEVRALVRRRVRESVAACGDWRPAIDGLRDVTPRVWGSLSERDRLEFLYADLREWERLRHRMPPVVAAGVRRLRDRGQLRVVRGDAVQMIEMAPPGTWVVNATGPDPSLTRSANPVFRQLFADGVARRGALGIGLDTTASGRLIDRAGFPVAGIWTIGCPRRGQLWESTAIPEIRDQAVRLARCVAAATDDALR